MSTNINNTLLNNFIIKNVGSSLSVTEAQKLGIEDVYDDAVTELDDFNIDIDDFTDDLIAEFTTLYVTEQEKKAEAKDKDKEKEEQSAVKGKNSGAGV